MRTFWKLCLIVTITGATAAAAEGPKAPTVVVDFAKSIGKIRIHGVNNGPVNWGLGPDLTNYHKEAGFPAARLSDCYFGCLDAVDIHCIFPIFDADANDPKYYTFAKTDAYLSGLVKNGTQIIYRLGESTEERSRHYFKGGLYTHPPKDYAKWTKICINIIRHYNEGWANGFHYNIKYWEIWNEPEDGDAMWAGTFQQYLDLYAVVAKAIKAHDPSLKVGGPATCCIWGVGAKPFLAFCRDHKDVPVDFLSWHCYGDAPNFLRDSTVAARKLLGEYGFKDLECLVTEWHPMWYGWGDGPSGSWQEGYLGCFDEMGNPTPKKWATMREKFDAHRGPEAAAFAASAADARPRFPAGHGVLLYGRHTMLWHVRLVWRAGACVLCVCRLQPAHQNAEPRGM